MHLRFILSITLLAVTTVHSLPVHPDTRYSEYDPISSRDTLASFTDGRASTTMDHRASLNLPPASLRQTLDEAISTRESLHSRPVASKSNRPKDIIYNYKLLEPYVLELEAEIADLHEKYMKEKQLLFHLMGIRLSVSNSEYKWSGTLSMLRSSEKKQMSKDLYDLKLILRKLRSDVESLNSIIRRKRAELEDLKSYLPSAPAMNEEQLAEHQRYLNEMEKDDYIPLLPEAARQHYAEMYQSGRYMFDNNWPIELGNAMPSAPPMPAEEYTHDQDRHRIDSMSSTLTDSEQLLTDEELDNINFEANAFLKLLISRPEQLPMENADSRARTDSINSMPMTDDESVDSDTTSSSRASVSAFLSKKRLSTVTLSESQLHPLLESEIDDDYVYRPTKQPDIIPFIPSEPAILEETIPESNPITPIEPTMVQKKSQDKDWHPLFDELSVSNATPISSVKPIPVQKLSSLAAKPVTLPSDMLQPSEQTTRRKPLFDDEDEPYSQRV